MLVYQPAIDWLTLSEPVSKDQAPMLYALVKLVGTRQRAARRLGYVGHVYEFSTVQRSSAKGTFFYGERNWKGKDWVLLVASGESAHWLLQWAWEGEVAGWATVRCTRIDVQITIPWPDEIFYLRTLPLTQNVKATTVHGLSEGDEWSETLYLGSRSSPVLVRAYRKRIEEDGKDWLRVEVEYKREASKRLFWVLVGDRQVDNWFQPVLERCEQLYTMIDPYLEGDPDRPTTYRVVGRTFHWLSTTVANCVCRLLNDDDQHEAMVELVAQWYALSQACQNRRTMLQ
jgi:hypothetical protein